MDTEKEYSLCAEYWMADVYAKNIDEAIALFELEYSGEYTVYCAETGESKEVIFE